MARGYQKEQWTYFAHLITTLINFSSVRDPRKSPVTFAQVYPFKTTQAATFNMQALKDEWLGLVDQHEQATGG
jgi:hypothetical protein